MTGLRHTVPCVFQCAVWESRQDDDESWSETLDPEDQEPYSNLKPDTWSVSITYSHNDCIYYMDLRELHIMLTRLWNQCDPQDQEPCCRYCHRKHMKSTAAVLPATQSSRLSAALQLLPLYTDSTVALEVKCVLLSCCCWWFIAITTEWSCTTLDQEPCCRSLRCDVRRSASEVRWQPCTRLRRFQPRNINTNS